MFRLEGFDICYIAYYLNMVQAFIVTNDRLFTRAIALRGKEREAWVEQLITAFTFYKIYKQLHTVNV
jgi:hypothetical protein